MGLVICRGVKLDKAPSWCARCYTALSRQIRDRHYLGVGSPYLEAPTEVGACVWGGGWGGLLSSSLVVWFIFFLSSPTIFFQWCKLLAFLNTFAHSPFSKACQVHKQQMPHVKEVSRKGSHWAQFRILGKKSTITIMKVLYYYSQTE